MHDTDEDPFDTYSVVVNHEEQYSIWPAEKPMPAGWRVVGKEGTKKECLDRINELWTDMRPLSLRKKMEEWAGLPPPEPESSAGDDFPPLVDRLSVGEHPVVVNCRPERTVQAFKDRLAMGHVHVLFTSTRGGTELGVRIQPDGIDWNRADFENASGEIHFVGTLMLDYVKVRCVVTIELPTLEGTGHLEKIEEAVA
jgi:uncharacterized protein YbdZ (MbtH family)